MTLNNKINKKFLIDAIGLLFLVILLSLVDNFYNIETFYTYVLLLLGLLFLDEIFYFVQGPDSGDKFNDMIGHFVEVKNTFEKNEMFYRGKLYMGGEIWSGISKQALTEGEKVKVQD